MDVKKLKAYLVLAQQRGDLAAQGYGLFLQSLQFFHSVCISLGDFLTLLTQGAA